MMRVADGPGQLSHPSHDCVRGHFYSGSLSSVLLTLVLIALSIAIVFHVRFLPLARREHRETASALHMEWRWARTRLALRHPGCRVEK